MPIPLISNFSINAYEPIDTRIISTSSLSMNNILYKYEGLTTYRLDEKLNYTWDGATWSITSNGIYGGSGKLNVAATEVSFGTTSVAVDSESNRLQYLTYTVDSGANFIRLDNFFKRHTSGETDPDFTTQFVSQLFFGITGGPYIHYNPAVQGGNNIGGISFGTYRQNSASTEERMRIEGNGKIRFKPQDQTEESTKSLNIGFDTPNDSPFLGYNWGGVSSESNTNVQSSYLLLGESRISVNFYNGTNATHSVIFQRGLVTVNGGLEVIGGTLSASRSIQFGASTEFGTLNSTFFVRTPNNFGIKYNSTSVGRFAELICSSNDSTIVPLLRWGGALNTTQSLSVLGSITFTYSKSGDQALNTSIFATTLKAEYKTQLWDNRFNPEYTSSTTTDLSFIRTDTGGNVENVKNNSNSAGTGATTNNIFVKYLGDSTTDSTNDRRTTGEFIIFIGQNYAVDREQETSFAKNTFEVGARDYDRIYYFYLDGMLRSIQHQVRWWLGEIKPNGDRRYVQIGNIETGNKDNYGAVSGNDTSYGAVTDYRTRYYSQTVFVPAFMTFKIQFRFHVSLLGSTPSSTIENSPRVFMNVIRTGRFGNRSQEPTAPTPLINPTGNGLRPGLGYPGSVFSSGPPPQD